MENSIFKGMSEKTLAKVKSIENINEFEMNKIHLGLISLHSNWSAQSIIYGKSILGVLENHQSKDFEIYIIESDSIATKKQMELFGIIGNGYFESVWIENGQIVNSYQDNNKGIRLDGFLKYLRVRLDSTIEK